MDKFELEYKRLNPAQRAAVNNIDGPLLVLAGPGTGKTQLLAMRVANILKSTDTSPEAIICLTFTNKAAVNMKERIIGLTAGAGAKSVVKTFHSFAAEIMNSYPDYFWNHADLTIAPDTVQLDIIESILSQLPLHNPLALKFAGQFTLTGDVVKAINLAKDAGLSPDKLTSLIKANLEYINEIEPALIEIFSERLSVRSLDTLYAKTLDLPDHDNARFNYPLLSLKQTILETLKNSIGTDKQNNNTKKTGALKQALLQNIAGGIGLHKEKQRNDWWLRLAEVYSIYRTQMHERGFYDFADMLVEVITQLENSPDMLADVQERFLYVLVDEFQDSNPAQLKFSQLISEHHTSEGKPNLMVVGDDDQSIYKFNGAELSNMLNFKRQYPDGSLIVLKENYRSSQAVLDEAKKVIDMAQNRLISRIPELDKNLVAVNKNLRSDIGAVKYKSREEQLSSVAKRIKQNHKKDRRIAVLARGHDSLIKMASILGQIGVPVSYERQSNILEHEIVEQSYLVIKLLDALQRGDKDTTDALVHRIIRHPLWGLAPADLWDLATLNFKNPNWLDSLRKYDNSQTRELYDWFLWLGQESVRQPLAVTIEHILGLRGNKNFVSPLKAYFQNSRDSIGTYFQGLSAIQLLRSTVADFSKLNQSDLSDFIRFFEVNFNNQKVIADESPFVTGKDAVQLLTVHKAKGLEFDQVYIVDAIEKNWQPKKGSRKPPINLPLQPVGDDNDDYVRLFYVAITRAKQDVFISAYTQDHAGSDVAISPIVQSAFEVVIAEDSNQEHLTQILEQHLRWPDLGQASELDILKARLSTYNLSVTDLINFMDLQNAGPQYFKEMNLLRLPQTKNPSLSHGTAMHSAMEYAQLLSNHGKFDLNLVLEKYQAALSQQYLAVAEYNRFAPQGKQMLERLFRDFSYRLPNRGKPEQKLKDIALGEARLSGKLDLVCESKDNIDVIDYKTGKGISNLDTNDKSKQLQAWKYKMQLAFYQILLEHGGRLKKGQVYKGKMVFIESDDQKYLEQIYQPDREELDRLEKLIQAVWRRIVTLDLPKTTKYSPDFAGIKQFEDDLIKS